MKYIVLLYYKYVHIENPEIFREEQRTLCQSLNLKGRIIVASEGINGTLEGTEEDIEKYIATMKQDARFADIDFKTSVGDGASFPKLRVKSRSEIVTFGAGTADLRKGFKTGSYLSPDKLQQWFDEKKDIVVVDMRNDYEHAVGHFENSIRLPVQNFKEIPNVIEKIEEDLKDKTVVSVCTGGVRCEKATSYLLERGFSDVYQLEGGMVRYLEKHHGKNFKGSLYVFDNRKVANYDAPEEHTIVGRCLRCGIPNEEYVNCNDPFCHNHFICCLECQNHGVFCSELCKENTEHRNLLTFIK